MPHPDRRREILEREHHADKPVHLLRIVGRPQLEHHLLLRTQVELVQVDALVDVPDVQLVAVLARQQQLGVHAVLDHVRRAPFGGDHRVVPEVPPEVVGQLLRAAVLLPLALQLERLRIHQEDAARTVAGRRPERAPIHAVGTAMDRVGGGVAGLPDELLGLDHLHDLRLLRVGLRIEDVDPRRPDAGDDQVAPLHVRVRRLRAQARAAGVPAEMVELVVPAGEVHLSDQPAKFRRLRIDVHDAHGVTLAGRADVEQRDICQAFRGGLHRHRRRGIKSRIRPHRRHRPFLLLARGPAAFRRHRVCPSV